MKSLLLLSAVLASALRADPAGDLFAAIRQGAHARVAAMIASGADVNAPRADGVTPLLHAVVTGDVRMAKLLLAKGANVKATNGADGITALHAAVFDPELTRLLLAAGADPNAATASGQTPLAGAAMRRGAAPVIAQLLAAGANPNPKSGPSPLRNTLIAGDVEAGRLLSSKGADPRLAAPPGRMATQRACLECMRLLTGNGVTPTNRMLADAATAGSVPILKLLVESGAPVNGQDQRGYTPLMRAVLSNAQNPDAVAYLLGQGADTAPKNETGDTALTMANRFGAATPIVALLEKAGAPGADTAVEFPSPVVGNTVEGAIARGLPLLQKSAPAVFKLRGCVSCHNNTLPAMVVAMAKRRGFAVDEEAAARELRAMQAERKGNRQSLLAGTAIPEIGGYILLALHEAGHSADDTTDLYAHQLAFRQEPDGRWRVDDQRPPQEYSDISGTALAVRGLALYAPPGRAAEVKARIGRARAWLIAAQPRGAEEHAMRLLGLRWAQAPAKVIEDAARKLTAEQRADGGWAQLPGMEADAYATGLALYALHLGGGAGVSHDAYKRGVRYLLDTQRPDGSWFVQTRSYPFQPYFESGFPYGHSQWISAAGSSWAMLSLLLTMPETPR